MVGNDDDDRKDSKSNGCRRMFEELNKRFSSSTTQNVILVCVVFVETFDDGVQGGSGVANVQVAQIMISVDFRKQLGKKAIAARRVRKRKLGAVAAAAHVAVAHCETLYFRNVIRLEEELACCQ